MSAENFDEPVADGDLSPVDEPVAEAAENEGPDPKRRTLASRLNAKKIADAVTYMGVGVLVATMVAVPLAYTYGYSYRDRMAEANLNERDYAILSAGPDAAVVSKIAGVPVKFDTTITRIVTAHAEPSCEGVLDASFGLPVSRIAAFRTDKFTSYDYGAAIAVQTRSTTGWDDAASVSSDMVKFYSHEAFTCTTSDSRSVDGDVETTGGGEWIVEPSRVQVRVTYTVTDGSRVDSCVLRVQPVEEAVVSARVCVPQGSELDPDAITAALVADTVSRI